MKAKSSYNWQGLLSFQSNFLDL